MWLNVADNQEDAYDVCNGGGDKDDDYDDDDDDDDEDDDDYDVHGTEFRTMVTLSLKMSVIFCDGLGPSRAKVPEVQ